MRSHPVGLDIWFLVGLFVYFHTSCLRTAKALAWLRGCAGSPEPSLVAYVLSAIISWAGSNGDWFRQEESGFQRQTKIKARVLEAIISNEGSTPDFFSKIAHTTAALNWKSGDKNISRVSKVNLMRTLILSIFLDAWESWAATTELERRIQTLEMRPNRRLLNISYKEHLTNEDVRNRIQNAIGVHDAGSPNHGEETVTQMVWSHLMILCHSDDNSAADSERIKTERKTKDWEDNIKEWTETEFGDPLGAAEDGERWKGIVATSSVVPRRRSRLRDWDMTYAEVTQTLKYKNV